MLDLPPELAPSWFGWAFSFLASFMVGFSKAGLKGIAILTVTIMALVFGSKASTGILIPLLLVADVLAVWYYNRHAQWHYLIRLVPAMAIGIGFGSIVGRDLPEAQFKMGMAVIILVSVLIMYWWERNQQIKVPKTPFFAWGMGVTAGFATMIGNLAGSFTNLFFLGMRTPKNDFIGTAAWLFLLTNLMKLPIHIFSWETITLDTLAINIRLVPGVLLGFVAGVYVVKLIKEDTYRKFILAVTVIGAVVILFR